MGKRKVDEKDIEHLDMLLNALERWNKDHPTLDNLSKKDGMIYLDLMEEADYLMEKIYGVVDFFKSK